MKFCIYNFFHISLPGADSAAFNITTSPPQSPTGEGRDSPAPQPPTGEGRDSPTPQSPTGEGRDCPAPQPPTGEGRDSPAPQSPTGEGRDSPAAGKAADVPRMEGSPPTPAQVSEDLESLWDAFVRGRKPLGEYCVLCGK